MTTMQTMTTKTVTVTRRTRSLGYGVTSHVARDGRGIAEPRRQIVGLTPRRLIADRNDEIRSVGGHPEGGGGCYWREAFWIGDARVVFSEYYCRGSFLWDLASLARGELDEITVTVAV
jgi:hypothetical protein